MSYWRLFYHVTWSTKYRLPLIVASFENNLHNEIVAKAKALGGIPYAVGGTEDHVHLAVSVPPGDALSKFIGQVKGASAHFVNHEFHPAEHFDWQHEFGVVSFGGKHLDMVVQYIKNQRKHHAENNLILELEREIDQPEKNRLTH